MSILIDFLLLWINLTIIFTAIAICKLVCPEFWEETIIETKISRNELIDTVLFITQLLEFDFVFIKPCDDLDHIVDSVMMYFEEEEIILIDMVFKENHFL